MLLFHGYVPSRGSRDGTNATDPSGPSTGVPNLTDPLTAPATIMSQTPITLRIMQPPPAPVAHPVEEPAPPPRARSQAVIAAVTATFVVCVGVLAIAAGKAFVERKAAVPPAASVTATTSPPVAPLPSLAPPPPEEEEPAASVTPVASASSTPAPPKRPLVVPARARPASTGSRPVGEKRNLGF